MANTFAYDDSQSINNPATSDNYNPNIEDTPTPTILETRIIRNKENINNIETEEIQQKKSRRDTTNKNTN